jgi:hypothetical protein
METKSKVESTYVLKLYFRYMKVVEKSASCAVILLKPDLFKSS